MEDSVVDRNMQREIRAGADKSIAILQKGLDQYLLELQVFENSHKKISRHNLWNLFTDEEIIQYTPEQVLKRVEGMNPIEQRIILKDATKFYLRMWLDVEGPYSSTIKRKIVNLDLYK